MTSLFQSNRGRILSFNSSVPQPTRTLPISPNQSVPVTPATHTSPVSNASLSSASPPPSSPLSSSSSPTLPSPIDMKRLLSKPAPLPPRHGPGSGSESDSQQHHFSDFASLSPDGVHQQRRQKKERDHPRMELEYDRQREHALAVHELRKLDQAPPLDLNLAGLGANLGRSIRSTSDSRIDRRDEQYDRNEQRNEHGHSSRERDGKDKRQRNVLRRRPSTGQPKSSIAPPQTSTTIASASSSVSASGTNTPITPASHQLLSSPLPPISPPSPLTPSILPTGDFHLTVPSHSPNVPTRALDGEPAITKIGRSTSLVSSAQGSGNGYEKPVPAALEGLKPSSHTPGEAAIADERHKATTPPYVKSPRSRTSLPPALSRNSSTPSTLNSSPASSRPHSPTKVVHPNPRKFTTTDDSNAYLSPLSRHQQRSYTTLAISASSSRSSSPGRPISPSAALEQRGASKTNGVEKKQLTPAAAVVAAYKRQTALEQGKGVSPPLSPLPAASHTRDNKDGLTVTVDHHNPSHVSRLGVSELRHTAGVSRSFSASESGLSAFNGRMSLDGSTIGAGGEGFSVIEKAHGLPPKGNKEKRPHTSSGITPRPRQIRATAAGPAHLLTRQQDGHDETDNPSHQPYYTVFGSHSGRVVAVGGPADHDISWSMPFASSSLVRVPSTGLGSLHTNSEKASTGGLRTLTRKVSGRWRKSDDRGEDREQHRGRDDKERKPGRGISGSAERGERRRPSLQHESGPLLAPPGSKRKGLGTLLAVPTDAMDRRSLRLSIDKFPQGEELRMLQQDKEANREKARAGKEEKEAKPSPSTTITSTNSSSGSNKIWKLVKRISTGGLREKYALYDNGPPPVPAIPKEYSAPPYPAASRNGRAENLPKLPGPPGNGARSPLNASGFDTLRSVRRKASLVLGMGNIASSSPTTWNGATGSNTSPRSPAVKPSPPTAPAPRHSSTTRSSSPNSSDVASTKFFGSGHIPSASAHSSASSLLFEDVPPIPRLGKSPGVGNYIIPPSELGRMNRSDDGHSFEGSQESGSLQSHYQTTRSHSQTQNALQNLKVVVPPSQPSQSPNRSSENDDYFIVPTPAVEMVSLPLPPRKSTHSQSRLRHDSGTPLTNADWESSWSARNTSRATKEGKREWDTFWSGDGSALVESDRDKSYGNDQSGSPMLPTFSTEGSINNFSSKHASEEKQRRSSKPSLASNATSSPNSPPSSSETMSSSHTMHHRLPQSQQLDLEADNRSLPQPPPRPSRAMHRPPPASGSGNNTSEEWSYPKIRRIPVPVDDTATSLPNESPSLTRRSSSEQSITSTATIKGHIRRRSGSHLSISNSPPSSPLPPHRTVKFRELGHQGLGTVLTEQEKAARWEDLLERSAQAGGTLRLDIGGQSGEHGLKSDRLRFSERLDN